MTQRFRFRHLLLVIVLIGGALVAVGYRNAVLMPVVERTATIGLSNWPRGQAPLRVALLSDIHVAGPDMPPSRLARIVEQVNARRPDLVLLAGDLTSDKLLATRRFSEAEAVAPLAGLRARLGVVGVLGNHDHWRSAEGFRRALARAKITLLENEAVKRGPLVIGGADDIVTRNHDPGKVSSAMKRLSGPRLLLTHSPDIVPTLPEPVELIVAGHTHCGQISLPRIGIIFTASSYGRRYACGLIGENGQTIVVSAGLGTSILPLRFRTPPDFWLLTLGPKERRRR